MFTQDQLTQLKSLLEENNKYVRGDITNLKGDIANLGGDVTTLKGDIENLRGELKEDIKRSETKIKKVIIREVHDLTEMIKALMAGHEEHSRRITAIETELGLTSRKQ